MRRLLIAILLFLLQIGFYYSLRYFPVQVETIYSTGMYPYLAAIMRALLGWIPFSVGDLLYAAVIILSIRWLWVSRFALIPLSRKRKNHNHHPSSSSYRYYQLFRTLNIVLLLFHFEWGFNYYRLPLHQVLEIEKDYTTEQLVNTVETLIKRSNKLHEQLQAVDSMAIVFDRDQCEIFDTAPIAFEQIEDVYPALDYGIPSIKKSLLTIPLTYMGYSGYLNPITGEAHINAYINNYKTPVLTLHEMSHQLGFAKENEANFIAIIAGMRHPDPYFQYSATIFALRYCLNDLYRRDPETYREIAEGIRPGIFSNYRELTEFWLEYEGVIEEVSQATYNTYLKANNQPGGMETYSYVVALLVNYDGL